MILAPVNSNGHFCLCNVCMIVPSNTSTHVSYGKEPNKFRRHRYIQEWIAAETCLGSFMGCFLLIFLEIRHCNLGSFFRLPRLK